MTGLSNLALRASTAAVLVPLVVWGVLALSTTAFALGLTLFIVAGAWEWADLADYAVAARAAYLLVAVMALAISWLFLPNPVFALTVLGAALIWWLAALFWVLRFQAQRPLPGSSHMLGRGLVGLLVLVPAWIAMVMLHGDPGRGPIWVMLIMVIVWGADTGAYFAGRRFGKRKLASRVSPGKTVEGVLGGLVTAAAICAAFAWWRMDALNGAVYLVVLGTVTALASVLGDLTESLVKRSAGRKDSGILIPGHGGVLDRIDSLTAAAPVFAAGLAVMDLLT
ncbi:MAG TPA: phosphatidate cytidylyltransferase [Gammaproteobacteria bacterium]